MQNTGAQGDEVNSDRPTLVLAPGCTESPADPVIDVVFLHGLGGDRWHTWTGNEQEGFWPEWLAEDFPNCAIYTAGYDSNQLAGFLTGEGASIRDIASIIAAGLLTIQPRGRRMILITHSLGGLVAKQMLRICSETDNDPYKQLASSVSGIVFLATPHQGSMVASVLSIFNLVLSKQVQQLQYSSDDLIGLQAAFASWATRTNVDVRPFYETQNTAGIRVVDQVTANPGIANSVMTAVQADHFGICKPSSREAVVYSSICGMINDHVAAAQSAQPGTSLIASSAALTTVETDHTSLTQLMGGGKVKKDLVLATLNKASFSLDQVDTEKVAPDIMLDYEYYTAKAPDDRRDLGSKLADADRAYQIKGANRKKERFNMALQRSIAQPSAVTRYTRLLADVETRFNRHVPRLLAEGADAATIDRVVENDVIEPCVAQHSSQGGEISSALVDSALYYLAGNCHVGWDNA